MTDVYPKIPDCYWCQTDKHECGTCPAQVPHFKPGSTDRQYLCYPCTRKARLILEGRTA